MTRTRTIAFIVLAAAAAAAAACKEPRCEVEPGKYILSFTLVSGDCDPQYVELATADNSIFLQDGLACTTIEANKSFAGVDCDGSLTVDLNLLGGTSAMGTAALTVTCTDAAADAGKRKLCSSTFAVIAFYETTLPPDAGH